MTWLGSVVGPGAGGRAGGVGPGVGVALVMSSPPELAGAADAAGAAARLPFVVPKAGGRAVGKRPGAATAPEGTTGRGVGITGSELENPGAPGATAFAEPEDSAVGCGETDAPPLVEGAAGPPPLKTTRFGLEHPDKRTTRKTGAHHFIDVSYFSARGALGRGRGARSRAI